MECRLQHSKGPWRCQVLLRYERDEFGNRLPEVREEKFGPVLHDKSLLEDTLRRAQLAILNPSVQAKRFVDYDLNDEAYPPLQSEKQLQFSCNVVCLDLQIPDVTDLSFIDLPGSYYMYLKFNVMYFSLLIRYHFQCRGGGRPQQH